MPAICWKATRMTPQKYDLHACQLLLGESRSHSSRHGWQVSHGTLQGLPSEICMGYDYSGDLVVVLRWVELGEPPPLSLNDSRVLPLVFLSFGVG